MVLDYKQELFMNAFGVEGIWDGDLSWPGSTGHLAGRLIYSELFSLGGFLKWGTQNG